MFRSHVNPVKDGDKRDRTLGIMSIDSALNFLEKRGDSPVKNYLSQQHSIHQKIPMIDVNIFQEDRILKRFNKFVH